MLLLSKTTQHQLGALHKNSDGVWLFVGPPRVGKYTAAKALADKLTGHASDVMTIAPEGASLGIEQVHQLINRLQLKSFNKDQQRVVIIDEAEKLTREAQNALLKLLEECPVSITIILVAAQHGQLLPTIRSRCQTIQFGALPQQKVEAQVKAATHCSSKLASEAAELAEGAVGLAIALAGDEELLKQYRQWQGYAKSLQSGELYDKVLAAQQVAADKVLEPVLTQLQSSVRTQLRQAADQSDRSELDKLSGQLQQLSRWQNYLAANGNPKFALDNLALEFS